MRWSPTGLAGRDKHEAMRIIGGAGVPAGAVLDTMELMNEPSFTERGHFADRGTTRRGRSRCRPGRCASTAVRQSSRPLHCSASTVGKSSATGSAMSAGDVDALRKEGVI